MYHLNVNDLRIKYTGCYVVIPDSVLKDYPTAAKVGVMLDDYVDSDGENIGEEYDNTQDIHSVYVNVMTKTDDNQTRGRVIPIKMDDIEFIKLDVGVINTKHSAIIIHSMAPEGNAKYRTLHHESSLLVVDPFIHIRRYLGLRTPDTLRDWFMLKAWYENVFPTADEALALVKAGSHFARAFSSKFIYSISLNTEDIVLLYYEKVVGRVVDGEVILEKWAIRFKEELQGYGISVGEGV